MNAHLFRNVSKWTNGFLPADLNALCTQAALHALTRQNDPNETADGVRQVNIEDFKHALQRCDPSELRHVVMFHTDYQRNVNDHLVYLSLLYRPLREFAYVQPYV